YPDAETARHGTLSSLGYCYCLPTGRAAARTLSCVAGPIRRGDIDMRRNGRMALGALGIAAARQIAGVSVADAEPIDNTDAVVTALADGEGERAAELIRDSELRTDPQKLGSAINAAGTKSVEQ